MRHRAYDKGRKVAARAEVPTICVGNVTVGGTGKTPHTEMILRLLLEADPKRKLAVLSRGYKRKTKGYLEVDTTGSAAQFGDEPLQIARKFPQVKVAVDKDRVEGCKNLADRDAIVLDDAFQYKKLKADLDIVLVDYNRPVFQDKMLPFGNLRDLPERIFKADIIIVSKCPAFLSEEEKLQIVNDLHMTDYADHSAVTPEGKRIPVLFTHVIYKEPKMVFENGNHRFTYADRVVVISGIANNNSLRQYLSGTYRVEKLFAFPDHHEFTRKDIEAFNEAIAQFPTAGFAATEKDCQRLIGNGLLSDAVKERLFTVPIEAVFLDEQERKLFFARIEDLVEGRI